MTTLLHTLNATGMFSLTAISLPLCLRLIFHLQLHLYLYLFSNITKCSPTSRSHSLQSHVHLSLHPWSVSPHPLIIGLSICLSVHLSVRNCIRGGQIRFVYKQLSFPLKSFPIFLHFHLSCSNFPLLPPSSARGVSGKRCRVGVREREKETSREDLLEMVYMRLAMTDH